MSGFIPDLASWALGGGAGNSNSNNIEATTENAVDTMSPDELRAQRLARLEQAQNNASASEQKKTQDPQPMDVDMEEPSKQNLRTPAQLKPAPPSSLTSKEATDTQMLKKVKSDKESPIYVAQKLQRRKELLLKKVLQIVLEGSSLSTADNSQVIILDIGSVEISTQTLSEIIATRLSMDPPTATSHQKTLMSYLAACHRLASEELKTLQQEEQSSKKNKQPQFIDELSPLLREIQGQLVSYAATCLMEPDLFPLSSDSVSQLAKCLIHGTGGQSSDPTENHSITFGVTGSASSSFYHLLIEELVHQDESVLESTIIPGILEYFMNILRKCESMLDQGSIEGGSSVVIVSSLTSLCSHKIVAQIVAKSKSFLLPPASSPEAKELVRPMPSSNNSAVNLLQMLTSNSPDMRPYMKRSGPALDKDTILGLCLRIGVPDSRGSLASVNPAFSPGNILRQSLHAVEHETSQQRLQLRVHQTACYQLIMQLIKGGATVREKVLQWFQDVLLLNVGASALRPDTAKISSSNLLLNTSIILLKLCEPFVNDEKKQHLIDAGFVSCESAHGGVFATSGDEAVVRLGGDDNINNPAASKEYSPKNSFIPLCFFYCARSLHLGLSPLLSQHENLLRHISHFHWQLTSNNRDLQSEPRFAMMIARQRSDEVALYQEDMITDTLRFCGLLAKFLFSINDDNVLKTMPEDFVSDMCDIIISIAKLKANLLRGIEFRYVFKLIVKLLSAKYASMVKNYNLRAMLGDVLYELFLPTSIGDRRDVPGSVSTDPLAGGETYLLSDVVAQESLAPSLLLLYGEVEHTGYYDKMSHRAKIASVIKYLWESHQHRPAFRRITQNKESFIKFANGIMNETNTLIATVMQKLPEIREAQRKMKNPQEWSALSEDEQAQLSSRLEDNERDVKHSLPLCNKTLQMFGYLSTDADIRNLFLMDELCQRLVTMLLHVLTKLVGSKGLELKVDNPDQYEFRPKEMLRDLCAIFALFASYKAFQDECAKSGSDPSLLRSAVKTCRKLNLLTGDSLAAFESLPDVVETATKLVAEDEELLRDAPDEFLDEILSTFMKDPVILPSGHYVDRTTISQHLLNDLIDPFNRFPMTIDDVKPATELKQRMDEWLESKRAAKAQR